MSGAATLSGGCQCGRVRYRVTVADDRAYLCHCRMCQRATGGVAAALVSVPRDAVAWEREPDRYRSSPIARRGFCAACGTPLTWEGDAAGDGDGAGSLDLTVGSFDTPGRFRPWRNLGVESRHDAWSDTGHLPALRSDELPAITARWIAACGKLPD